MHITAKEYDAQIKNSIKEELKGNLRFVTSFSVPVAWRRQYCGVFEANVDGVIYYLLDNQYYFKRDGGIYGHYDDAERFAFFSRAILEIIPHIDFKPDIIHAHYGLSGLLANLQRSIPVVTTYHGSDINLPKVFLVIKKSASRLNSVSGFSLSTYPKS